MTLGPLEYVVLGFEGDRFDGSIADELGKVVDRKIIRIVDLVFVQRDGEGNTTILELDNKDDPRFAQFAPLLGDRMALFTPGDLEEIADTMPAGTAGLIVLFEHRWAEDLKDALAAAGGFLVGRTVVPPEVLAEVSSEIEASNEPAAVSAGSTR